MQRFVPLAHLGVALFAVIELGLTAYIVSPHYFTPSSMSFMLFNSVWSLLVLVYIALTPRYVPSLFHGTVSLALEWITTIFWFAGSIALAVYWGSPHCGGNTYCGSVQAAIAFGFFLWALFAYLAIVDTLRARGHASRPPVTV